MTYDSLVGLKPEEYQHPGEKVAMKVLKSIPLADTLSGKYVEMMVKLNDYPQAVGNYYRITEKTNPRIYNLYKIALKRLDVHEEYPLFSKMDYYYNACAIGGASPLIVLNSSIISNFTDAELLHTIGHEIGHIKSGHVIYSIIATQLNSMLAGTGNVGAIFSEGISYAIMEWLRNAEYTADRAGLIASGGDFDSFVSEKIKYLGYSKDTKDIDFSLESILAQAEDFNLEISDPIGKMLFVTKTARQTHPWTILRIKQMHDWYTSGDFEKVIKNHL